MPSQDTPCPPSPVIRADAYSALWEWHVRERTVHLSPACAALLCLTGGHRTCGIKTLQARLHPEDHALLRRQTVSLLRNAAGGNYLETVVHVRRPCGSYQRLLVHMMVYHRNEEGRALRIMGECASYDEGIPLFEQIIKHKQLYEYAFLTTQNGLWEWDVVTGYVYYSPRYMELLGYTPKTMPGRIETWRNLLHPEDAGTVWELQEYYINSPEKGDIFESRHRLRAADDTWRHMLSRGKILRRNRRGRALVVVGLCTDITEITAMRATLELQSERMSYAFSAARDGIWDWNAENDTVYYSPRYLSMVGYTEKNFPPDVSSWLEHIHPDERAGVEHLQRSCLASPEHGDSFESIYRFRSADGSWRWILGRGKVVKRDARGRGVRAVGVHTDITELRHTQESLRYLLDHDSLTGLHSRSCFEQALDRLQQERTLPVSIISCDMDGLKLINDTLGHDAGDQHLKTAAGLLQSVVRSTDLVARMGGDELNVLLPACPAPLAEQLCGRIAAALDSYNADPNHMPLFLSLGMACSGGREFRAAALLKAADTAMLSVKKQYKEERRRRLKGWLRIYRGVTMDMDDDRL